MKVINDKIYKLVQDKIEAGEKLGSQSGGSGHMGHVSYVIDHIEIDQSKSPDLINAEWQVDYQYTIFIETEFTYYPDNPPYETKYTQRLFLNHDLIPVKESEKEVLSSSFEPEPDEWEMAHFEINSIIAVFLEKIEWDYGENRAPILYPPEYNRIEKSDGLVIYECKLSDDTDNKHCTVIQSDDPADLIVQVKKFIKKQYGFSKA
ncbi:MAG: hypothetical protein HOC82_07905 [Bacteroidetes bacterium]|nr:hypothetical protein [Bacteroidota bacterium]